MCRWFCISHHSMNLHFLFLFFQWLSSEYKFLISLHESCPLSIHPDLSGLRLFQKKNKIHFFDKPKRNFFYFKFQTSNIRIVQSLPVILKLLKQIFFCSTNYVLIYRKNHFFFPMERPTNQEDLSMALKYIVETPVFLGFVWLCSLLLHLKH